VAGEGSLAVRVWRVVARAVRRALTERAPEAAAGIGFFAVFSFFPLLLILVGVAGRLLADLHTQEQVLDYVLRLIPVSRELVSANMGMVLRARGAVSVLGGVGLLWSATSALTSLVGNLNRAWPGARQRHVLLSRLLALAIVGALAGIVVLFLALRAVAPLAANWAWAAQLTESFPAVFRFVVRAAAVALMFGATILLYGLVPAARVRWRDAALAAALATVAFATSTVLFTWYLRSGLASYNIVYGSLGALVALLAWVYVQALIALFGAHFCASLAHERAAKGKLREPGGVLPEGTGERTRPRAVSPEAKEGGA
jgi:membrane protein